MTQHDYDLANQAGAAFRTDLNNVLLSIVSNNSGATAPSTTFAYMWWADTTTGLLKIRNAANNAWVTVGTLATANLALLPLTGGTLTGSLVIQGNVTLGDASGDTITANAATLNWVNGLTEQINGGNVRVIASGGEITLPNQPTFLATNSVTDSDATGDGTVFTLICDTEVTDLGADYNNATGVFTAPVAGRYAFSVIVVMAQVGAAHTSGQIVLSTSNRSYVLDACYYGAMRDASNEVIRSGCMVDVDMDAADTASILVTVSGGTKVVDITGSGASKFSGNLMH